MSTLTLQTVGNWYQEIEIPLAAALSASTEMLGKTGYKACEMAIAYMAKSAGTLTKVSPDKRPIVANPKFQGKGGTANKRDMRNARYGVYKYNPKTGEKYFSPIYRGGQFGAAVKYISKTEVLVKVGSKSNKAIRTANKALKLIGSKKRFGSVGVWQKFPSGTGEFEVAGLKEHPKRVIRRKGLARKSWMWGLKGFHPEAIRNVTDIKPIISAIQCGLVLTDRIRYLSKITPSNLVEEVSARATNSIMAQVAMKVERDFSTEIPLRASERKRGIVARLETEFAKHSSKGMI